MSQDIEWGGARRLLKSLRDIMKSGGTVQQRLDRIASLIARNMVAEVCSVYVLRAGEVLELFATEGLKPEAVHRTRLRLGEGLVGAIALSGAPLSLPDAQSHPNFAYRPETGEEIYQSLLGVPIQREGHVLGVLVVQNVTRRQYEEEEVETLETVAMVLAELLASGEVITAEEVRRVEGQSLLPTRLSGIALSEGIGMGEAVQHHWGIVIEQLVAEDAAAERARLEAAVAKMREAVDSLVSRAELADGDHGEILETYRMFAHDRGWLERMREAVRSGLTAEAAVKRVQDDTRGRMVRATDTYLRERLIDLDDLAHRLLQQLVGAEGAARNLPQDAVVIARSMGPAELLDYDRDKLRGIVLEEGGGTAHVAIVARALGIPMVGRCDTAVNRIQDGDFLIVDGDNGQVLVRPTEGIRQSFADSLAERRRRQAAFAATRDLPAVSRDGVRIELNINAGLLIDLPQLEASGADGIGLYRTEIPFMIRDSFPDVAAQTTLYAQVLSQAGDRPVVFRTLDVGGDKLLPYWGGLREDNPAMGWRAMRIALDRPAILRQQLRALLRAAAGRELRVMFPMVSEVMEFLAARRLLEKEMAREKAAGRPLPSSTRVGAMLEVPGLAWQLPALLPHCDFLSVGSNDLFQFLFASDRENPRLARRYDLLSPGLLAFLRWLSAQSREFGVPLALCGEMASHPLEAMALIGCGLRSLSMAPAAVPAVRTMVRDLEVVPLENLVTRLSVLPDHSLREALRAYAIDRGISI